MGYKNRAEYQVYERKIRNYMQRCCKVEWNLYKTASPGEREVTIYCPDGTIYSRYFDFNRMLRWHGENYFSEFEDYMTIFLKEVGLYVGDQHVE